MRSLKPKADRPVPAFIADIAAEVGEAAARLGLDCLIVGATARDLLLDHVHGLPAPRATRDIDMAFALAGWPDYERLRAALLACPGWHASAAQTQRLLRVHGGSPVPVDLIPFGAIESGDRTIAWPPGHDIVMNVAGYTDALASAVRIEIAPGCEVKVASLPGLALLKLFAWADRHAADGKDAIDLCTLADAGNALRVYDAAMPACDYEHEPASAWLLGHDAAALARPDTRTAITALLDDANLCTKLALGLARALPDDDSDRASRLLSAFAAGFRHGPMTE